MLSFQHLWHSATQGCASPLYADVTITFDYNHTLLPPPVLRDSHSTTTVIIVYPFIDSSKLISPTPLLISNYVSVATYSDTNDIIKFGGKMLRSFLRSLNRSII